MRHQLGSNAIVPRFTVLLRKGELGYAPHTGIGVIRHQQRVVTLGTLGYNQA
jgi:hypothetical protein